LGLSITIKNKNMGLDMYLQRKTYVKNWDYHKPEEKHKITIKLGGKTRKDINPDKISHIVEEVGYWRKANQIHAWFVKNVQEGVDNCLNHYVSRKQLQELLNICLKINESPKDAALLLPVCNGFFFGSTEYNDEYFQDIKDTIEILQPIIDNNEDNSDYKYSSSW
jgi:hypothetical protein